MPIEVKCKTEDCDNMIVLPLGIQEAADHLDEVLHKKNYYLCSKCHKVGVYAKEDHISA
ncbi:MAG: hypothetical protein KQJ78_09200 [Deltaproteobacteria bacterium]|nr:hypothetical protein [Deltaproteobacteria bacterium]